MKSFSLHFMLLLLFSVAFTSCSKDEDDDDQTTQQTTPNTTPTAPSDADGLLAAVNSIQIQEVPNPTNSPLIPSSVDVEFNIGVGAFFENNNPDNLLEAGTVTVNTDNDLELQSNNSYITTYSATSTDGADLGFDEGSTVTWNVTGGAGANAFPAPYTTQRRMPGNIAFSDDYAEIDISQNLTVSIDQISTNADSVLFLIGGENNAQVKFTAAGNATSHTFAAAELSVLSGTGIVQVVPYTIENATVGGKNIYFVNEVVITSFTEFK